MSCLRRCIVPPTYAGSRYPFRGIDEHEGRVRLILLSSGRNCFKLLTFHHFQITLISR